jgi:hypothetical protein
MTKIGAALTRKASAFQSSSKPSSLIAAWQFYRPMLTTVTTETESRLSSTTLNQTLGFPALSSATTAANVTGVHSAELPKSMELAFIIAL